MKVCSGMSEWVCAPPSPGVPAAGWRCACTLFCVVGVCSVMCLGVSWVPHAPVWIRVCARRIPVSRERSPSLRTAWASAVPAPPVCVCSCVCMCGSGVAVPVWALCAVVLVVAECEPRRVCDSVGFVGIAVSIPLCAHVLCVCARTHLGISVVCICVGKRVVVCL